MQIEANGSSLASQYEKMGSDSKMDGPCNASQNTPVENLIPVGVDAEVSPEISKSVSVKRFKFSPGMVNFIFNFLKFSFFFFLL